MSPVPTPPDTKVSRPISSMPCVCTLLYKENQYRLKTSWTERHPVKTEMPWTGKVAASMTQCCTMLRNPTQMLHYWIPGHGVNKRTLGQKHDLKNKLQNYSCSKWPNRLTLKHEWHINCIASWTFRRMRLSIQVWADVLLQPRALYLFKSPDFNVLDKEIFLLRKCMIPKRFTGMTSPMVEISIKPKSKFSSSTTKC